MPPSNNLRRTTLSNLPADVPKIKIPFPPNITPEQFLRDRPLSRESFRSPNSFFIYRQQLVKQLKLENYNDQMVKVSKWAGILWSNEPNYVKEHYKNIEKDIQKLLNEQYKHEQENPCQIIFVFENPDKKDNDLTGMEVLNPMADTSPDWSSSNENSPTMPDYEYPYDEQPPTNFYPLSPTFPSYDQFNYFGLDDIVGNNNFEPYISMYDNMDAFSFLHDYNNQFPY